MCYVTAEKLPPMLLAPRPPLLSCQALQYQQDMTLPPVQPVKWLSPWTTGERLPAQRKPQKNERRAQLGYTPGPALS